MPIDATQNASAGSSGAGSVSDNAGEASGKIEQATERVKGLIEEATVAQLESAEEILPAKAVQSAVQGLPKQ